jgi:5-methylthioribose kinase
VLGRVVEEPADQDIHDAVRGRGEDHPLALRRGAVEQPAHDRQEAQVGHVVGFIHRADLDVSEVTVALVYVRQRR